MNPVAQLLTDLTAAGLTVRLEGDKLMVAPPSKLMPELRERIAVGRDAVVTMLRAEQLAPAMAAFDPWQYPERKLDLVAITLEGRTVVMELAEWESLVIHVRKTNEIWAVPTTTALLRQRPVRPERRAHDGQKETPGGPRDGSADRQRRGQPEVAAAQHGAGG